VFCGGDASAADGSSRSSAPSLFSGRERLIDPRDANWHHLHGRSLGTLRLRCAGCRARISVAVVPPWYRRKVFDVVLTPLDAACHRSHSPSKPARYAQPPAPLGVKA
jgi:hypothetical protein